ncbi:SGNH/GDSL hydrolase family protein [Micromonospora sp. RP3T]|uniref:SGNH/GDSL hydrolase family protein n=1 Tax=Micromonospora sp. RP3T TaxID=2135446 RepID=UPI000D16426C|nr:SGNH/GDSL hydrolase family protein [Micromonospora sp. RP3T]
MSVPHRVIAGFFSVLLLLLSAQVPPGSAAAATVATPTAAASSGAAVPPPSPPPQIRPDQRNSLLGVGWRTSKDRAWALSGDATGLHVLVAKAAEGYTWRTATTLTEPGFETDRWIGNACVTGSGRRLVVAYAPRTFTNDANLFSRGAFTAVVDLDSGAVRKLSTLSTLAYYSPGCGIAETAVFTQAAGESTRTRLVPVDAVTGRVMARPTVLDGQVTSAVPVGTTIVAADRNRLIRITAGGRRTTLARTRAVPFRLTATAGGGVAFLDRAGDTALVAHLDPAAVRAAAGKPARTLFSGPLTGLDLTRDAVGHAYVTGTARPATAQAPGTAKRTPAGPTGAVTALADAPKDAAVSTRGAAVLASVAPAGAADPRDRPADPRADRAADLTLRIRATGRQATFTVTPGAQNLDHARTGSRPHPTLTPAAAPSKNRDGQQPRALADGGSPTDPVEAERTCSVPRNDPRNQALQPKPRQVEWAVDQAVTGALTVRREANWKNLGMPAYTPQGLFPPGDLYGGGYVPPQVLLGIAAQESNLWQTTGRALPGMTANPLIGNFYGREIYDDDTANDWDVRWDKADCGYGVMQITDGMRLAGREGDSPAALPYQTQRAVALDFAANVAAGLKLLITKWNQTRAAGMYVNNGDPKFIENWFFAIWAYNSGFHPDAGDGSPWGVGWLNNPVNPNYPANRDAFLDKTMADAAHPLYWPYQEKVLGFAGHPIELPEGPNTLVPAFRPAIWNGGDIQGPINRTNVKPPATKFCDATNDCVPGGSYQPTDPDVSGEPAGPCAHRNASGQYDLKCWYHKPAVWKTDCPATCGIELLRFNPGYAYQEDGTSYPPRCDVSGLPSTALVVDDVPRSVPSVRPGCAASFTEGGTFSLNFGADGNGRFPSKVDFHQFGAGFNGHFYSSFTRGPNYQPSGFESKLRVQGTWRLSAAQHQWMRLKVFIPDVGAWTRQARYDIDLGNGQRRFRVVNQAWQAHTWVDLGVFKFDGVPGVTLSTRTADGIGADTVVFDAMAFIPTTAPTSQYVALGDSYSSGEGLGPFHANSDYRRSDNTSVSACHRSVSGAYPTQVKLPGHSATIAQEAADGTASFAFLACSGALTTNVTRVAYNNPPKQSDLDGHTDWGWAPGDFGFAGEFQYGELPQVEQGWLDQDTTHVTLTIGGNDARFAEVVRSCVASLDDCYTDGHKLTRANEVVDPEPLRVYEKKLMREWLPTHLKAAYRAVHNSAPNATITVLGYPQLFEDRQSYWNCQGISTDEAQFLNTLADLLNTTIAHAISEVHDEGVDIRFVNVTQRWRDSHQNWTCSGATTPWVNAGIPACTNGSGLETPCKASYHPTLAGQTQLADVVNLALRGTGSAATVQRRILDYVATKTPRPDDPTGGQRWIVSAAQALEIAQRCLDLTKIGGVLGDPCMTEPMLVVTTRDADRPARTDAEAIERLPWWVHLNYTSRETRERWVVRGDWYNKAQYKPNGCSMNTRPTDYQCDEYPFFSSEFGAAWDPFDRYDSESSSRVNWAPKKENQIIEGAVLGGMYTACSVDSSVYSSTGSLMILGDPYLTIPVIAGNPADKPSTFYVC